MQKVKIHPLFILPVVLLFLMGKGVTVGATALAVFAHETGHYQCAKRLGFTLKDLTLMPYGAIMYAEDGLPDREGRIIALAGPAVNILFSVILCAIWWAVPALQPATKELFTANLAIGVFNLLPCYPLDGSRILLGTCENKKRCLIFVRTIGWIMGGVFAVLFVVSLFYSPAIHLVFIAVMFFEGATSEVKKEVFRVTITENYFMREKGEPHEEKTLRVDEGMKIGKLCLRLSGEYCYIIKIYKKDKEIACLGGQAIENMFYSDRDLTVGEYAYQNNLLGV